MSSWNERGSRSVHPLRATHHLWQHSGMLVAVVYVVDVYLGGGDRPEEGRIPGLGDRISQHSEREQL